MVFANPVSLLPHVAKSKTPSLTPYQGNNCTIYLGIFLIFSLLNDVFLHFHSQKQLMWNVCSDFHCYNDVL